MSLDDNRHTIGLFSMEELTIASYVFEDLPAFVSLVACYSMELTALKLADCSWLESTGDMEQSADTWSAPLGFGENLFGESYIPDATFKASRPAVGNISVGPDIDTYLTFEPPRPLPDKSGPIPGGVVVRQLRDADVRELCVNWLVNASDLGLGGPSSADGVVPQGLTALRDIDAALCISRGPFSSLQRLSVHLVRTTLDHINDSGSGWTTDVLSAHILEALCGFLSGMFMTL
ncbi:hypothetical protein BD413DRAFT_673244 [Trametes elegans]|nr:hypothetical protein BD413DRAFT_673244 [Trametes elegans]